MAMKKLSRTTSTKASTARATKKNAVRGGTVHIMPAPKGPRTVSHRRIKAAVLKVIRDRAHADA